MTNRVPPRAEDDDRANRERIRTSLDESLVVEAAAGTGKTTELVNRMVAVLRSGRGAVDGLVAVTFTRKAAGELTLRLRGALDAARDEAGNRGEQRRLEEAIARLEEAHIGTIHGFCAELLRERPVEAGIDPDFRELDEEAQERLFDRAFHRWIEKALDREAAGVARALTRGAESSWAGPPLRRLRDAARTLAEWRDHRADWEARSFDRAAALEPIVDRVREVVALVEQGPPGDILARDLRSVVVEAARIERAEELGVADLDALEAGILGLGNALRWFRKGRGERFGDVPRAKVVERATSLREAIEDFRILADADLAVLLRRELAGAVAEYEALEASEGVLDFLDLLVVTRDLLVRDPEVRRHFQERFTHLFVDEFQDTDPIQAEILLLLAADDPEESEWRRVRPLPGKLFLVGDPKQSIYRFRRADVILYRSIRDRLVERGVPSVRLTRSFRAVPSLQELVNAAFEPEMDGDPETGQPSYIPLAPVRDEPGDERPSIVALPVPEPYGYRSVTKKAIEASFPRAAAAFVHWLLEESGWEITDPETRERVPIEPRHVALLFRRYVSWKGDVTRPYVRALESRDVPHVLVGGRSFHHREEVETLRAALRAVEWPDDELSVFATLKGSLFSISDETLFRFREEIGRLHPFLPTPGGLDDDLQPVSEALSVLRALHRGRNRIPVAETVERLLGEVRAHAAFALRPAGNQVLANVMHVLDLARRFELRGGRSFRSFVERLDEQAERPTSRQSPVVEEGAEGVRLMTAHTAKGLEFPVVLLADPTARIAAREASATVDLEEGLWAGKIFGCRPWELVEAAEIEGARDAAEGVRLAYVAATRARDLLVIPAIGDGPEPGWLSPLDRAIYPPEERRRSPTSAPGCPPFGDASVRRRPGHRDGGAETSVRPGLHRPGAGSHRVVWWDPEALRLEVAGRIGVRGEALLASDEEGAAEAGAERFRRWRERRLKTIAAGGVPTRKALPAREAGEAPAVEIGVEATDREPQRPSGVRFGSLVHGVLQEVPYDARDPAVRALARTRARLLGAPREEEEGAVAAVLRALAHPVMLRAAAAPRVRRETPVVAIGDDGSLVEGVVDLAFGDESGWTLVDFKTDAGTDPAYRSQLAWYVTAIRNATGEPVEGLLLLV